MFDVTMVFYILATLLSMLSTWNKNKKVNLRVCYLDRVSLSYRIFCERWTFCCTKVPIIYTRHLARVCRYARTHVCTHMCTHARTPARTHAHVDARTHEHVDARTHTRTHNHHTHVHPCTNKTFTMLWQLTTIQLELRSPIKVTVRTKCQTMHHSVSTENL